MCSNSTEADSSSPSRTKFTPIAQETWTNSSCSVPRSAALCGSFVRRRTVSSSFRPKNINLQPEIPVRLIEDRQHFPNHTSELTISYRSCASFGPLCCRRTSIHKSARQAHGGAIQLCFGVSRQPVALSQLKKRCFKETKTSPTNLLPISPMFETRVERIFFH